MERADLDNIVAEELTFTVEEIEEIKKPEKCLQYLMKIALK